MLKEVIENKRLYLFEKAKKDIYANSCTLFQKMSERSWNWFEFKENSSLIEIPFKRDYENLKKKDKEKYEEFQNNRIKIYKKYSKILKKLLIKVMIANMC